jgi:hypothetical protein
MDFAGALDGTAGGNVWGRIFERCMVIRDYLKRRDLEESRAEELDQDLKEWEENASFWGRRHWSQLQRVKAERVAELEETRVDDGTPAGRRSEAAGSHSSATASDSGAAASSVKSAKTITLGSDTPSSQENQSHVSGASYKQGGTTKSGSTTTLPLASSMEPSMRGLRLAASAA